MSLLVLLLALKLAPDDAVRLLNADLLAHDSATATLTRWCAGQSLTGPPAIRALRDKRREGPAGSDVRALLGAGAEEAVRHRHVRLMCGIAVFSEADNWYLPAKLTPEMNRLLETTDTPFGRVVGPLHFHRQTLQAGALGHHGRFVLIHHALLLKPDGAPFSLVVERYRREAAATPPDR